MIIIFSFFMFHAGSFTALATSITNQLGVAVSEHPLATKVGMDVLKKGGNAIDAAVAVGYALGVVFPSSGNIGGGGFMLIHLANGKNTVLNFREKAPQNAKPSLYFDKQGKALRSSVLGYSAVGVPGTVLGLNTALKRYGTLPLKTLIQPAIDLACHGFILSKSDANLLKSKSSYFISQPNVAAIFLKDGKLYQAGDRLVQKQLSQTLKLIAQQGSNAFYRGKIADEIVKASKRHGGLIQKKDLINYHVSEVAPLICDYRGYQVITVPPPASGITLCEMLNISSGYPLSRLGYHTAESAHYNIEAMRYAYADRSAFLADPDFVKIPIAKLISKEYAQQIRRQILADKAGQSKTINPSLGAVYNSTRLAKNHGFSAIRCSHTQMHATLRFSKNHGFWRSLANCKQPLVNNNHETTAYAVADNKGNVVVVVYTINQFYGAKVIAGNTGFFLNNILDDFTLRLGTANFYGLVQGEKNLIAPNKRPLSAMAPVIITKNKDFYFALGTPGGSTIPSQTLLGIENIIDYHMNIKDAVDALRFHMQWLPDLVYIEPNVFDPHVSRRLKQMGYHLKLGSPFDTLYWGSMVGIFKNPENHQLTAAKEREDHFLKQVISY